MMVGGNSGKNKYVYKCARGGYVIERVASTCDSSASASSCSTCPHFCSFCRCRMLLKNIIQKEEEPIIKTNAIQVRNVVKEVGSVLSMIAHRKSIAPIMKRSEIHGVRCPSLVLKKICHTTSRSSMANKYSFGPVASETTRIIRLQRMNFDDVAAIVLLLCSLWRKVAYVYSALPLEEGAIPEVMVTQASRSGRGRVCCVIASGRLLSRVGIGTVRPVPVYFT